VRQELAKKVIIVCRGETERDLEDALIEAVSHVTAGRARGHNSNDHGEYYFEATDEVPDLERPA